MTKRLITHTVAFLFLFSSLGYACPDLSSLSKHQRDFSFEEIATAQSPCQESDHAAPNPVCYHILHDRIWYTSPRLSVDKVVSRVLFYVQEITSGFDASPAVFRATVASEIHSKTPLNLLYRILRV
jgi:hypothetical protein